MSVPRSLASLAGQSRSLATASTAPLYPPGLADVFDPTPAPRPAGLLPTPASTRTARLESHYLNTLREDLMILHYDNSSRALATLEQDPEWTDGVKVPDDLLKRVFSADDRIARDRVKGGGLARYGPHTPTTAPLFLSHPPRRPFKNPIDYSTHKPNREWRVLPPHPPPYSPVASRLPALKGITLVSYPPLAHQNKMSVLSSIMCLQSISGAAAQPYFAENSDHARNLKAGQVAGSTVRLESGDRMWSFLDRFVNCVLPRVREWEGFNSLQAWKGDGKIVLSIDAQSVGYFPEIEPFFDSYPALYDLEIIMETSAATRGEAVSLLSGFQIPFLSREKEIETLEAEKKKEEERDPFAKFKKGRKKAGKTARGNQIVGRAR